MIDTVAFWVNITKDQFSLIQKRSIEYTVKDNDSNLIKYHGIKNNLNIGSFDRHIGIRCNEEIARLEFSLAKQYFGHNIALLYPSQVVSALDLVFSHLKEYYGDFPHYSKWNLCRLDLCYAWKLPDKETANKVLEQLKLLEYPRKSKHPYPTSVMWRGRHFSPKFYLKEPEFLRNDFNNNREEYQNADPDYVNRLFELCTGNLRFEITFRSEMLRTLFGNKSILDYRLLLNKQDLTDILNRYLNRLLSNFSRKAVNDRDVLSKLKQKHGQKRSIRLFEFYNLYFSDESNDRKSLLDNYHPSTIWRKKRDIASAGIGLPNLNLPFEIDLSIPSSFVVNEDSPPVTPVSGGSLGEYSNTA